MFSKNYISNEFSSSGSIYTSFDGIVKKLLECLDDEVDNQTAKDRKRKIVKEDLFAYMEKFFTRPLSPLEYDVIQGWKNKKYDFTLVKAAREIAAQCGNKSIRYIDTIIFEENSAISSFQQGTFMECPSLEEVILPEKLESIDDTLFYNCNSLECINLPFVGNTINGTLDTHFGYIFGASSGAGDNYVPKSLKKAFLEKYRNGLNEPSTI